MPSVKQSVFSGRASIGNAERISAVTLADVSGYTARRILSVKISCVSRRSLQILSAERIFLDSLFLSESILEKISASLSLFE